MSAALARYSNPTARIGHAGPDAPIHADERLEIVAPAAASHHTLRDRMQVRRIEDLEGARAMLCDALEELVLAHAALRGNDDQTVRAARRALTLGRIA